MILPAVGDLLERAHVVALPMRVPFRGVTVRELVLLEGPAGWGEFGPFPEYGDAEAAAWLAGAVDMGWRGPPPARRARVAVNATVPAVPAGRVPEVLAGFPGCRAVKVKVAERGRGFAEGLAEDVARVAAVRDAWPAARIRVDANGGWDVPGAIRALRELDGAAGGLEYAEQPCASVPELVAVRARLRRESGAGRVVPVAADESIRRAEDPLRVVRAGGADVAVVKAAPLGGPRRLARIAAELDAAGVDVVVSSALDSAVGMTAGLAAAAALPEEPRPCGLGTGGFFVEDVTAPRLLHDGMLDASSVVPDPDRLAALRPDGGRRTWWLRRLERVAGLLAAG